MFEVLKPDATADDCDVFEDLATAFYCQYPSENNPYGIVILYST